jgi:hypothetical protein
LYLSALMLWWSSTSEHVATFNWRGSAEVRDVDTITSRLVFPKATIHYYPVRDSGAEAIMTAVPKMP